jgi:hypothetical protein
MGWKDDPLIGTPAAPAIDIRPGSGPPARLAASSNPYSAGLFPLGRVFTVGDEATIRETDVLTGVEKRTYTLRVTRVDAEADRVEINSGIAIMDLMGNTLKAGNVEYDVPVQFSPVEIYVGKKWRAAFIRKDRFGPSNAYYDIQIVRREKIVVPAGEFDTFRLESQGWNTTHGARLEVSIWLVPGLNYAVRREWITRNNRGQFTNTERHELVSLRQQAIGL